MAGGNSFDPRSPGLGLGAVGGQVEKGMEQEGSQAGRGRREWPVKEPSEQRLEKEEVERWGVE